MINAAGLALVEEFEGCSLKAYLDTLPTHPVWTIGWGHTGRDVYAGLRISQAQADALLLMDLTMFGMGVQRLLEPDPTDNQFAALVSFAYNLGLGALASSTLLRLHNDGLYTAAARQFPLWDHAGGKVIPGLLRRRNAEAALYLTLPQ